MRQRVDAPCVHSDTACVDTHASLSYYRGLEMLKIFLVTLISSAIYSTSAQAALYCDSEGSGGGCITYCVKSVAEAVVLRNVCRPWNMYGSASTDCPNRLAINPNTIPSRSNPWRFTKANWAQVLQGTTKRNLTSAELDQLLKEEQMKSGITAPAAK